MKNIDGDHLSLAPSQGLETINSFDVNKVLQANIIYLNKKRKFQAEQSCLRLSKQKYCDRKLNSDSDTPSDVIPIKNYFEIQVSKGNSVSKTTNHESESVKESNSFDGDNMDYCFSASVSNEAKTVSENSISASEGSATLSLNISNDNFSTDTCSLGSRLILPYTGEESFLGLGCSAGCHDVIENENSGTEQYQDKEIEEMLYYNALLPKHVPLSGELNLNQGNQEGTKKLTIDKEFEEYFSMLML